MEIDIFFWIFLDVYGYPGYSYKIVMDSHGTVLLFNTGTHVRTFNNIHPFEKYARKKNQRMNT